MLEKPSKEFFKRVRRAAFLVFFTSVLAFNPASVTQDKPAQTGGQPPLVTLRLTVTDNSGHVVSDLRKEDLQILDDGNPETISYFAKEENPITYGLVIDASNSLNSQFQDVLKAARQIIETNQPEDQTFITAFVSSDNIVTIHELTNDRDALTYSLSRIRLALGQTALIDGLYLAAQYAVEHKQQTAKRYGALILISDGENRVSYYKESDLFKLLEKSGLQVFALGLTGKLDSGRGSQIRSRTEIAYDFLNKLARETGGRAFILNSPKELANAIEQMVTILRTPYVIGYRPAKNPDKGLRKVKVKVVASPEREEWKVFIGRASLTRS